MPTKKKVEKKIDKEFLLRSFSSIFIVVITLFFIYSHNICFDNILMSFIGIFMAYEWENITSKSKNKKLLSLIGAVYIMFTITPLLLIKFLDNGEHLLMWLFLLIWSEDTFAYIVGGKMNMGKHKITKISPKKSYEGLFGGMVGALLICGCFANYFLPQYKTLLLISTPFLCILEQLSDITESYLKRKFNVKDSGDIIPGHGGILDRFDGFLYTSIAFLCIISYLG